MIPEVSKRKKKLSSPTNYSHFVIHVNVILLSRQMCISHTREHDAIIQGDAISTELATDFEILNKKKKKNATHIGNIQIYTYICSKICGEKLEGIR